MAVDMRRPAEVTEAFRLRVAGALEPLGFKVGAKRARLARVRGSIAHRVEFSASPRNAPGYAMCFASMSYHDRSIQKVAPKWVAGGSLKGPAFADPVPSNVADSMEADALFAAILARLAFFDAMDDSEGTSAEVCRRYVPGLVDPSAVVPFLTVRRSPTAATRYAQALLEGRPELWPAFASAEGPAPSSWLTADHGTQLRLALAGLAAELQPPHGTVASKDPAAANLRCFLGRQLRAWGEPDAASALHRVGDAEVVAAHEEQRKIQEPLTQSVAAARCALRLALGEDRAPHQDAPTPAYFQYHVLHAPFGT
jgi:hypothetical protein